MKPASNNGTSNHRSGPGHRTKRGLDPPTGPSPSAIASPAPPARRARTARPRTGAPRSGTLSQAAEQRPLHFNSPRTAWTLSLLLVVTLIIQCLLMAYHDAFVLQIKSLEEDMSMIDSMATDALNSAYEYNNGEGGDGAPDVDPSELAKDYHRDRASSGKEVIPVKSSRYSMEPEDILKRARVDYSEGYTPSITVREAIQNRKKQLTTQKQEAELPPLKDVQYMYGNHSYILGLERCEAFREAVQPERRLMGPAGMFNSATNLLNKLLKLNCINEARFNTRRYGRKGPNGMLLQAPWGKHNPVTWRLHHEAAVMWKGVVQEDFLPIVMIKDPITWMSSMCRHPYEARWRHKPMHCPNLVPNKFDRGRTPGEGEMGIKVKWATSLHDFPGRPTPDERNKTFVNYKSLAHLWNQWYGEWQDAPFPRLMVRFEDLIFHAEETVGEICKCGGGTLKRRFRYVEDSAKGQGGPHAGSAGFLASMITYGNKTLRMEGILKETADVEYARKHLDGDLMELFGYAPI